MISYHPSWEPLFAKKRERLEKVERRLQEIEAGGEKVYPPREYRYRVFEMDLASVRVVILGQDPYHGEGQAHGLSFSVPAGIKVPPSLQNIFKEIQATYPEREYTFEKNRGDLSRWANEEGIFLLNASLSVLQANPGTHMLLWKEFTDEVIRFIAEENTRAVFLLLGAFAQGKGHLIQGEESPSEDGEERSHRIIQTSHPSPLGAHRGFLGSRVFRICEERLGEEIDWRL